MDPPESAGIFPLGATVEIYRTPLVEQVTGSDYENDYPALAGGGPSLWLSWQGSQGESDQVFLRSYSGGRWGDRITVTDNPADVFMSGVSAAHGKATVVWSERDGENWRLKARTFGPAGAGKTEILSAAAGSNLFHRVATDPAGKAPAAHQTS